METENTPHGTPRINRGIKMGLLIAFIGLALIGINFLIISVYKKILGKITGLGFFLFYLGLGMLLAPGKNIYLYSYADEKKELGVLFKASNGITKFIWIFYGICGFAAFVFTLLNKYWENIFGLFHATFAVTAGLFVIKHIIFLITNPAEKQNQIYSLEVEKYGEEKSKLEVFYYPTRPFCLLFILIYGAIMFYSAANFHDTIIAKNDSFKILNRDTTYDSFLVENLDNYVPVRFYADSHGDDEIPSLLISMDDVDLLDKYSSDEEYELNDNEMMNIIRLHLSKIIMHLAQKKSKNNDLWVENLMIVDREGLPHEYNYKNLRRIPEIRKFLQENKPCDFEFLYLPPQRANFIKDNLDSMVVYTVPSYDSEYIHLWTLDSFCEFMNLYDDEDTPPMSAGQMLVLFNSGYYHDTNFGINTLSQVLSDIGDNKDMGIIIEYGTRNQRYLWNWRKTLQDDYKSQISNNNNL